MAKQDSTSINLEALSERIGADKAPGTAPKWDFSPDDCATFDIRIGRDGTWYHQGGPIRRKNMCKLFSTVLRRSKDGRYFLITPVEKGEISVDDAPFTAVEIIVDGHGRDQTLTFRTNLDHLVVADASHPIRVSEDLETGEPSPYILVRDELEALILRPQFYQLVEIAEEFDINGKTTLGVWSAGHFFELGAA
ncbi:MAG TPA: DUF1285 domain-containing protein [Rhodospirillaceae bacterium]|nr:proteophosphoglycan precursor [Rhodospirillaceae bacterium]HAA93207.1 DUF1285 domain-containing protein [Rhodospirillaceae bacterium]HAT36284.1 DUF1285 domain-containing protein [Rhodospirillaceae bacterium]|tara:strand:- start:337 stop:915 length:579 start_codon:yes stop_codon:yes gene_type:complete